MIDSITGTVPCHYFEDGTTLTYYLRMTNNGDPVIGMTNGYVIESDGVTWGSVECALNPIYSWNPDFGYPYFFDYGFYVRNFTDGVSPDTIGIGGYAGLYGTGLPTGFDGLAYTITVGPISLNNGTYISLDSSFYLPANYWLWGIAGSIAVDCEWGGPYYLSASPGPSTSLSQVPIYFEDPVDSVLKIYIFRETRDVDLCSFRVQGKIPTYSEECAWVEGDLYVTDVSVFRFVSAWRPITESVLSTYTVSYIADGERVTLYGNVLISFAPGDVNLDGKVGMSDLIFITEYLFMGGPESQLEEVMDVDQNGRVDALDLAALSQLMGF